MLDPQKRVLSITVSGTVHENVANLEMYGIVTLAAAACCCTNVLYVPMRKGCFCWVTWCKGAPNDRISKQDQVITTRSKEGDSVRDTSEAASNHCRSTTEQAVSSHNPGAGSTDVAGNRRCVRDNKVNAI
jgi:hypothetical protein